jgi:hypothetical protein
MFDASNEKNWSIGEKISVGELGPMEWVEFDAAIERLNTGYFLGRWEGAIGGDDMVGYCTMNEDGDVYAIADNSAESEPPNPRWRLVPEPDYVLVSGHFDLVAHLMRQRAFSEKTFGPGARTAGVLDHIRKELREIEANPADIEEWVDVIILAFDGAWRAGWEPHDIVKAIVAKQTKNEARTWPDWRTADPNKAIEHDRSGEAA